MLHQNELSYFDKFINCYNYELILTHLFLFVLTSLILKLGFMNLYCFFVVQFNHQWSIDKINWILYLYFNSWIY